MRAWIFEFTTFRNHLSLKLFNFFFTLENIYIPRYNLKTSIKICLYAIQRVRRESLFRIWTDAKFDDQVKQWKAFVCCGRANWNWWCWAAGCGWGYRQSTWVFRASQTEAKIIHSGVCWHDWASVMDVTWNLFIP